MSKDLVTMSRRSFLKGAATSVASLSLLVENPLVWGQTKKDPYDGFLMGLQSYSLRNFSLDDALAKIKELGLHYVELYPRHLPVDTAADRLEEWKRKFANMKIKPLAYGVVRFTRNHDDNRKYFAFAKSLGLKSLSADPDPDSFESLDKLVSEFGVAIAIHNHGPGHRYATLDDLEKAIKGHHRLVGVCLDTGHFLRSDGNPVEAIKSLGSRVYGVHLKDVTREKKFCVLGEGMLDVPGVLSALKQVKFNGSLSLEYEEEPDNPIPSIKRCLEVVQAAVKKIKV